MSVFGPREIAITVVLGVLPAGLAFAAGGGAGAGASGAGAGVGAAGTGSAAVGGGAPAGRVGGGPPAGQVGGGAPGNSNPQSNGAAGTGNPSSNANGVKTLPSTNPAAGLENAPTTGGVIGGQTGVPPKDGLGAAPPPITGQTQPSQAVAPPAVSGFSEQTHKARSVKPKPCGAAARETDGTTTCIGLPPKR